MTPALHHRTKAGLSLRFVDPRTTTMAGTLVYLHGLGESGLCFEKLMCDRRLERWRHWAIDLPGYGRSPSSLELADFDLLTDFLCEWLAVNLSEPIVLLGHSMGGVIGTRIASRIGSRVRGLVNVEGNISLDDCTGSLQINAYDLESFCTGGFTAFTDEMYGLGRDLRPFRGYYASLRMCDPTVLHRDAAELVRLSRGERLAIELGELETPKVYLLGDPGGAGDRSRRLLDVAGVPWRPIVDAGHWPYLDQHDLFVDELTDFLGELEDPKERLVG